MLQDQTNIFAESFIQNFRHFTFSRMSGSEDDDNLKGNSGSDSSSSSDSDSDNNDTNKDTNKDTVDSDDSDKEESSAEVKIKEEKNSDRYTQKIVTRGSLRIAIFRF